MKAPADVATVMSGLKQKIGIKAFVASSKQSNNDNNRE